MNCLAHAADGRDDAANHPAGLNFCLVVLPALLHAAAELERRYREGQAVYEEVMLHRPPGARCTWAWVTLSPAVT